MIQCTKSISFTSCPAPIAAEYIRTTAASEAFKIPSWLTSATVICASVRPDGLPAPMLELIPKNPCDNLTLPKLERFKPDVYSMEEVEQLLNCAKGTSMYLPMMIEICLSLRRGELLALRWHHVDFVEGILSVEENLVTVVNERITKSPKTKSGRRSIQIPATLPAASLKRYDISGCLNFWMSLTLQKQTEI